MAAKKKNFLVEHWDYLVALGGVAVLAGVVVFSFGKIAESVEDGRQECEMQIRARKPAHEGVERANMSHLIHVFKTARNPPTLKDVDPKKANFLASERRVICMVDPSEKGIKPCGNPIPHGAETCPFCGAKQPTFVKIDMDTDHDGLPNDWEKKFGLNPKDPTDAAKDKDGDGFTNMEEFQANTDPTNAYSHPDYLDSLSVASEVTETRLPFFFEAASPVPNPTNRAETTYRLTFRNPNKKGMYGQMGEVYRVLIGEEIGKKDDRDPKKSVMTGFAATAYEKKAEEVPIKGAGTGGKGSGKTLMKKIDASVVHLKRISDGKPVTIRINQRNVAVDLHVDLFFNRGGGKKFTVTPGDEITLYKRKYKIVEFGGTANAPTVVVEDVLSKKRKELRKS